MASGSVKHSTPRLISRRGERDRQPFIMVSDELSIEPLLPTVNFRLRLVAGSYVDHLYVPNTTLFSCTPFRWTDTAD